MEKLKKDNWLKLYKIADEIKKLKPWKKLWDMDLFMYIEDNDIDNALYFCTMGKGGVHESIAVYRGKEICGYLDLLDTNGDAIMGINYQECLKVCYLEKIDTLPENQKLIKELNIKYKDKWTSFEKFERGYEFSSINDDDVLLMTKYLEIYYDMYQKYVNEKLKIDFENQFGLIRKMNKKTGKYEDIIDKIVYPLVKRKILDVSQYQDKLKKLKKNNMELEVDFMNYLPVRIDDCKSKDNRYLYPVLYLLADEKKGIIIDMNLIENKENYDEIIDECTNRFINFIRENGIPKKIIIGDNQTLLFLSELCDFLNIKIEFKSPLPMISEIKEMALNDMFGI